VPKVIGYRGSNVHRIHDMTGAKVRVRGRGSGHLEVETDKGKKEAPVPLMIAVTIDGLSETEFKQAVRMVIHILKNIDVDFASFCSERKLDDAIALESGWKFGEMSKEAEIVLVDLLPESPVFMHFDSGQPLVREKRKAAKFQEGAAPAKPGLVVLTAAHRDAQVISKVPLLGSSSSAPLQEFNTTHHGDPGHPTWPWYPNRQEFQLTQAEPPGQAQFHQQYRSTSLGYYFDGRQGSVDPYLGYWDPTWDMEGLANYGTSDWCGWVCPEPYLQQTATRQLQRMLGGAESSQSAVTTTLAPSELEVSALDFGEHSSDNNGDYDRDMDLQGLIAAKVSAFLQDGSSDSPIEDELR